MLSTTKGVATLVACILPTSVLSSEGMLSIRQNWTQSSSEFTGLPPCDALLSAGLGDLVLLATSNAYEPRVQSWWSANGRYHPWCFVQPRTAQELSSIIKALADSGPGAGDWHIAVRSGGHSYPGSNNVENGVTIDLGMMNQSHYDPSRKIASVEPGAAWKDVYSNLLNNGNVTVTGGRDGGVGVGGFLLGGGISYYLPRNGFACDQIVNFEVVLANGTIVNANADENSDLWKALKGGALNFGIVSRFDLQAMPAVDLAYGISIITSNFSDQVIDAVVDFTNRQGEHSDDALITLLGHEPGIDADEIVILIQVNTRGNLNTTGFDKVNKIPTVQKSWAHTSLAAAANASQVAAGAKNTQRTLTFLNTFAILHQCVTLHTQLVTSLTAKIGAENYSTGMVLQPLPSYISGIAQQHGGNMLGLERLPSNAIIFVLNVGILNGDDAALALAQAELGMVASQLEAFAKQVAAAADLVDLNYAAPSQDPLGSYGVENLAFMRGVASKYDPEGFWQQRVPGGFKLSRAVATAPRLD